MWPPAAHRLGGVGQQVDQDLPDLIRVDVGGQVRRDRHLEGDRRRQQRRLRGALDQRAQTGPVPARRAVAGEIQEIVNRPVGALDLAADAVQVLGDLGLRRDLLAEMLAHEIERRFHHAQRIAQLVADAGGELADGRQPLGVAVLGLQILAVGLEHDRELEVHDLIERLRDPLDLVRIARELGAQDVEQADADPVHRREHVRLRQRDAHVHAPDARAQLVVGLVVGAEQHLVHPADERLLEPLDLRRAARDRPARPGVGFDRRVEVVDDRRRRTARRPGEARAARPTTRR